MMFPGAVANTELQQAAADKVKNDVGTFVLFGLLIEADILQRRSTRESSHSVCLSLLLINLIHSCCTCVLGYHLTIVYMETDPQLARFLQQLQSETQRQKFTEQVHTLTGRCWDVCFADSKPPSKLDGKTATCLQNCVNRMIDASNFMVEHLQKMESSKMS